MYNYIEYYYNGERATVDTIGKQAKGNVIQNYEDKNIYGYKLDKVENFPLTITENENTNVIKIYYTARTDLTGTVNYYLENTTTKLADSKELTGLTFGTDVEQQAIDIEGYNKVNPTSKTITVGVSGNEINFYYTARTDLTGTVNYYLENTTTKLADSKELTGLTFGTDVEQQAIDIEGYNKVNPTSKTITVGVSGNEINFYYTARTDLTGTVNYYLENTTTKLADSKELTGLTFGTDVEQQAIDIEGYNKVNPTSKTITVGVSGNEINFYYTARTDLTGTVNYYLENTTTKLADSKELTGLTFGTDVEQQAIDIEGYNKVNPTSKTITVGVSGNEINFYYTARTDLTGTVNYYLENTTTKLADSKELTGLTFGTDVEQQAIDIEGYNKVNPTSKTITVGVSGNEINFYYTARTDLTGTVNYYLENTTTKLADSKELTGLTFGTDVEQQAIDIEGYNKVNPTSKTITVGVSGNEINFYYTARTDLTGTVNYYLENTTTKLADSKELTGLTFGTDVEQQAIDIEGYNKVNPTSKTITVGVSGNEINFYYTARTDLTGTVNYYLENTTTKLADSKELTGLTFGTDVEQQAIDIEGYNKVNPTSKTITVGVSGNEINFYYTARTDIGYTINYYKKDITTPFKSENLEGTFSTSVSVPTEKINANIPNGYKFEKCTPIAIVLKITTEQNILNVYYTPTLQSYVINYYKEGTTEAIELSERGMALADSIFSAQAKDLTNKGYKLADGENPNKSITISNNKNEINFYYTARTDLTGIVNYYLENTTTKLADSKELTGLTFGTDVEQQAIDIEGYNKVDPTSKTITVGVSGNEINFYYTARTDLSYIVKYFYNGVEDTSKQEVKENQTYGNKINGYTDKSNNGEWILDEASTTVLPLTIAVTGNVIKVYYVKPIIETSKIAYVGDTNKIATTATNDDVIRYDIIISNTGKTSTIVNAYDTIPTGTSIVGGTITNNGIITDTKITWANISVDKNSQVKLSFKVKINNDTLINSKITNVAQIKNEDNTQIIDEPKAGDVTVVKAVKVIVENKTSIDKTNIVLVLDLSDSMNDEITGGKKLNLAKTSMINFINSIYNVACDEPAKISMVVFSGYTDLKDDTETRILTFNGKTVAKNRTDANDLITAIRGLKTEGSATRIDHALDKTKTAVNTLKANYPNNRNIVVFLGDGEPTGGLISGTNDSKSIKSAAKDIKNTPAKFYTIAFNMEDSDLLKDMSSGTGYYFTADNGNELTNNYSAILSHEGTAVSANKTSDNTGKITVDLGTDTLKYPIKISVNGVTTTYSSQSSLPSTITIQDNKIIWNVSSFKSSTELELTYGIQ
jgi:Mg-chelatase subunit ChlD